MTNKAGSDSKGTINYNDPFPDGIDIRLSIPFLRAKKGDIDSELEVMDAFLTGNGVPQNMKEAFKWALRIAEQGDPRGQYQAGIMYLSGDGVKADEEAAINLLSRAADQGHQKALEKLNSLLEQPGYKLDEKSLADLKRQAEKGSESACLKLVNIYHKGLGCEKDPEEAFKWAMECTKHNNSLAEEFVGFAYVSGTGVKKDLDEAEEWFHRSDLHGSPRKDDHEKIIIAARQAQQSNKTPIKQVPIETEEYVDFTGSKYKPSEKTGVTFDDIIGLDEAKEEIMNSIVLPTLYPDLYSKFKKKSGGGILLYGLPGTGKTMFVQAVATEINAKFFNVRCSDIISKWVGESEENIKLLFEAARRCKRAIIFFDEFDSLGRERSSSENQHNNNIVNELLSQIQGFEKNKNTLLLLAASNRPWDIDSALLRPGRFNKKIYIPLPDKDTRIAILKKQLTGVPVFEEIDYSDLGDFTDGFNCADVVEFAEQMKMNVINRTIKTGVNNQMINQDDVDYAKRKVKSSVTENDKLKIKEFEEYSL